MPKMGLQTDPLKNSFLELITRKDRHARESHQLISCVRSEMEWECVGGHKEEKGVKEKGRRGERTNGKEVIVDELDEKKKK